MSSADKLRQLQEAVARADQNITHAAVQQKRELLGGTTTEDYKLANYGSNVQAMGQAADTIDAATRDGVKGNSFYSWLSENGGMPAPSTMAMVNPSIGTKASFGAYRAHNALLDTVNQAQSSVSNFFNEASISNIGEEERNAYQRYKAGQASELDMQLLNAAYQRREINTVRDGQILKDFNGNQAKKTNLERLQEYDQTRTDNTNRASMENGRWGVGNIGTASVNRAAQAEMNRIAAKSDVDTLKHNYAQAEQEGDYVGMGVAGALGIASQIGNAAEAYWKTPGAVTGLVAEQTPQIAMALATRGGIAGRGLMAADSSARATNMYIEAQAEFEAKHGRVATPQEAANMQAVAALHAAADYVGDAAINKSLGLLGKSGAKATVKGTIGKSLATTVSEGATEGLQGQIESKWVKGESGLDIDAVGTNAALGGLAGGVLGTVGEVKQLAVEKTIPTISKVADAAKTSTNPIAENARSAFSKTFKKKVDPSEKLNPDNADAFDPVAAAVSAASVMNNPKASEEKRSASRDEFSSALDVAMNQVSDVEAKISNRNGLIDEIATLAEDTNKTKGILAQQQELRANKVAAGEDVTSVDKIIAAAESRIAKNKTDSDEITGLLKEYKSQEALDKDMAKAQYDLERIQKLTKGTSKAATKVEINEANFAAPETAESNAMSVANNMHLYSPEEIEQVASNPNVSKATSAILRKLSAATVAENLAKTDSIVNSDIIDGSTKDGRPKYVGLNQYTQRVTAAMQLGNKRNAEYQVKLLGSMREQHEAKALAAQEALNSSSVGSSMYVMRVNGKWEATDNNHGLNAKQMREHGYLTIHPGSAKLVNAIQAESDLINQRHDALSSLVSGKATKRNAVPTNVANVIKQAEAVSPELAEEIKADLVNEENTPPTAEKMRNARENVQAANASVAVKEAGGDIYARLRKGQGSVLRDSQDKPTGKPEGAIATRSTSEGAAKWANGMAGLIERTGVNKMIGAMPFNSKTSTNGVQDLLDHFAKTNADNVYGRTGDAYTPSDVVLVASPQVTDSNQKVNLLTREELAANKHIGTGVRRNASLAMSRELYAAIDSGAAIIVSNGVSNSTKAKGFNTNDEIIRALEENGYKRGDNQQTISEAIWVKEGVTQLEGNTVEEVIEREATTEPIEEVKQPDPTPSIPETEEAVPEAPVADIDIDEANAVMAEAYEETYYDFDALPEYTSAPVEETQVEADTYQETATVDEINITGLHKLSVIQDKDGVKAYRDKTPNLKNRNRVMAYFTQTGAGKLLAQALVKVEQLTPANMPKVIGREVTKNEKAILSTFQDFHKQFEDNLYKVFKHEHKVAFTHSDMVQQLANKDGKFDNNVVMAMSLAAWELLNTNGTTVYKTQDEVKKLLGMEADAVLPIEVYNFYADKGDTVMSVFQKMGRTVTQALGLKPLSDATEHDMPKLQVSTGALVYQTMNSMDGLLKTSTVIPAERLAIEYMFGADEGAIGLANMLTQLGTAKAAEYTAAKTKEEKNKILNDALPDFLYVRNDVTKLANGDNKLGETLHGVLEANKGNGTFLSKLFGFSTRKREPLLEPPKPISNKIKGKGATQNIPQDTIDKLNKAQARPLKVRAELANAIIRMYDGGENGQRILKQWMGIGTKEDLAKLHVLERINQEAAWDNDWSGVTDAVNWLKSVRTEDGKFPEFYYPLEVWVNQRVGYANNTLNVQTNLMHRALAGMVEFDTEINSGTSVFHKGKATKLGLFFRAVAEGAEGLSKEIDFGSIFNRPPQRTVDKMTSKQFLKPFKALIDDDADIKTAGLAMGKLMEGGSVTKREQEVITSVLNRFDSGHTGIQSLYYLSQYYRANGKKFNTNIGLASDGVTNGAIATQSMLNVLGDWAMGGLLPKGKTSYLEDITGKGERDLYERGGDYQRNHLANLYPAISQEDFMIKEISRVLDGSFGERKGAKKYVTPFNYGAGIGKLSQIVAHNVVESVYTRMAKIANMSEGQEAALQELNNTINLMIDNYNYNFTPRTEKIGSDFDSLHRETERWVNSRRAKGQVIAHLYTDGQRVHNIPLELIEMINSMYEKAPITRKDAQGLSSFLLSQRNRYARNKPVEKVNLKDNLLDTVLPSEVTNAIFMSAYQTRGLATASAMNEYQDFITARNEMSASANRAYEVSEYLINKELNKLESTSDSVKSSDAVLSTLTIAQMQAFREANKHLLNRVNSGVEVVANDGQSDASMLDTGYSLRKSKLDFNLTEMGRTISKTKAGRLSSGYEYRVAAAPGVVGLPLQIQGIDALVTTAVMGNHAALNMHDSNTASLSDFADMVQTQNKAFLNALINYDVAYEYAASEIRAITELLNDPDTNADTLNQLAEFFTVDEVSNDLVSYLDGVLPLRIIQAENANLGKLDKLSNTGVIHQYAGENGQYELTDADYKAIIKSREASSTKYVDLQAQVSELMDKAVKIKGAMPTAPKTVEMTIAPNSTLSDVLAKSTSFSPLVSILKGFTGTTKLKMVKDISQVDVLDQNSLVNKSVHYSHLDNTVYVLSDSDSLSVANTARVMRETLGVALRDSLNKARSSKASKAQHDAMNQLNRTYKQAVGALRGMKGLDAIQRNAIRELDSSPTMESSIAYMLTNGTVKALLDTVKVSGRDSLLKTIYHNVVKAITGRDAAKDEVTALDALTVDTVAAIESINTDGVTDFTGLSNADFNAYSPFDNGFHDVMAAKPIMAASEMLDKITEYVAVDNQLTGRAAKTAAVLKPLIAELSKSLPKSAEVIYLSDADAFNKLQSNIPLDLYEHINNALNQTKRNASAFQSGNTVVLVGSQAAGKSSLDMPTIMHELMHVVTHKVVNSYLNGGNLTNAQRNGMSALETMFNTIKPTVAARIANKENTALAYAMENMHEFVSVVATNPAAAQEVSMIATGIDGLSMTDYSNAMADVLGITSKDPLAAFFAATSMVMSQDVDNDINFAAPQNTKTTYSPSEVFAELLNGNTKHTDNLANVVESLLTPMLSKLDPRLVSGVDANQVWNDALANGAVPFASTINSQGFNLSDAELYAAEVIEVAVESMFDNSSDSLAYRELFKTFEAAQRTINPEDMYSGVWANATAAEKAAVQDQYDYVFLAKDNRYLSRFVALAMASETFRDVLGKVATADPKLAEMTGFDKFVKWFTQVVEWVMDMASGTRKNDTITENVDSLVSKLSAIDARARERVQENVLERAWNAVDDKIEGLGSQGRVIGNLMAKLGNTAPLKNNIVGRTMRVAGSQHIDQLPGAMTDMHSAMNPGQMNGVVKDTINEISTLNSSQHMANASMVAMKQIEKAVMTTSEMTQRQILNAFEDASTMTKDQQKAVTDILRTDIQSLLNGYTVDDIKAMVNDAAILDSEIRMLEAKVGTGAIAKDKLVQARKLADALTTGEWATGTVTNAYLIELGWGTSYAQQSSQVAEDSDVVNNLDHLVTLYSLKDTMSRVKPEHMSFFKNELNRDGDNGIVTALKVHNEAAKESKRVAFNGDLHSYIKGYLPNRINQHKELRIASMDDMATLVAQGFQFVSELPKDSIDPTAGKNGLFILTDNGKQRHISGSMSISDTSRKGSTGELSNRVNPNELQIAVANYTTAMQEQMNTGKATTRGLVPTFDADGNVVSLRYMMSHANQDMLLDRNNDFALLLGDLAGSNMSKGMMPDRNRMTIDALYEDYLENYSSKSGEYVQVGANANTERGREIFRMLPYDTRQHIMNTWPDGLMYVNNRIINTTFGYQSPSVMDWINGDPDTQNYMQLAVVNSLQLVYGAFFGDKANVRIAQTERLIQDLVRTFKDYVVIRSGITAVINIVSNMVVLLTYGVNPVFAMREGKKALQHSAQYRKDFMAYKAAMIQLDAGLGDKKKLQSDLIRLQESIDRNPLRDFIEEFGMQSSIVDDVALMKDHYDYQSGLYSKVDEVREKYIPKGVNNFIDFMTVAPNTPLYKFMTMATSEADFMAKYVLFQWSTKGAKNKVSIERGLELAHEAFINYDIPNSPVIEYLNKMGIMMFTKYHFRIQKAILNLMTHSPARLAAVSLTSAAVFNLPGLLSESLLNKPTMPGFALFTGVPRTLGQPIPIKLIREAF